MEAGDCFADRRVHFAVEASSKSSKTGTEIWYRLHIVDIRCCEVDGEVIECECCRGEDIWEGQTRSQRQCGGSLGGRCRVVDVDGAIDDVGRGEP